MARYRVIVPASVQKALAAAHPDMQRRLRARLTALVENPRSPGVQKLVEPDDLYRVRIGDYRAIYSIDDSTRTILVVRLAHRGEAYG